jgi:phosphoglucomutase
MNFEGSLLSQIQEKITKYLDQKYQAGEIRKELYEDAKTKVPANIKEWLMDQKIDEISPQTKIGIKKAIENERWEEIIYAFLDEIAFGTAGIRGIVASNHEDLLKLAREGISAPILKGPNTINDIVLLLKSAGVANYAQTKNLRKIVIGFDSRIQGKSFVQLIAQLFLAKGLVVYLFDNACPFPELAFAVPYLEADLGILISASHNDKRYNGYKLVNASGAQLDPAERNVIYENFIKGISTREIQLKNFTEVPEEKLVFLGGKEKIPGENYYGRKLINIHQLHLNHIKTFIMDRSLLENWAGKVRIGYSAYHGAGREAIPRLLKDFGFTEVQIIHSLDELNGLFPCFELEQQPDPGDPLAASIAVEEFKKEYGEESFKKLDILIGTDPDADRTGLIVKIPPAQEKVYQPLFQIDPQLKKLSHLPARNDYSWYLLNPDDLWTILLWYRLEKEKEKNGGVLPQAKEKFIVLNHTTTDALVKLALKYGLGAMKTWVGFAMISNATAKIWQGEEVSREKYPYLVFETYQMGGRRINVGAFEQSSGFTILGGPPAPGQKLGQRGHIRDKDGSLAAILLAELAAYAKSKNTTILELIDEKIYLDPQIGCYLTYCESVPYWGQFEGPTGLSRKISILRKVETIRTQINQGEKFSLANWPIVKTEVYKTGKYDALHRWPGFPDEGIRFFFDEEKESFLTVRPSGTSHCLRFHLQIKVKEVNKENLLAKKKQTYELARTIMRELKEKLEV